MLNLHPLGGFHARLVHPLMNRLPAQGVHVVVKGSVEYLGAHHSVQQRITAADRVADYHQHCAVTGVNPNPLA